MAVTPEDLEYKPELSLEERMRAAIVNDVEREIGLSVKHNDGVYDWNAIKEAVAARQRASFPDKDEEVDRLTAEVVATYQNAERHDDSL